MMYNNLIDKAIICLRNKEDAVKSSIPVFKMMTEEKVNEEEVYDTNYRCIRENINNISTIFVKFEDMVSNPYIEIERIVNFLEINVCEEDRLKAINNIKIK